MRTTYTFHGKPYRAAPAIGKDKWSVYAYDDHDQERYLGRVLEKDGYYFILRASQKAAVEACFDDFETAVEVLHRLCKDSGYLTQGHKNYLGGRPDAK